MTRQNTKARLAAATAAALCLSIFAWITVTTLRLEKAEQKAQQQIALEEAIRLSLWRLDATLASLIAEENARPVQGFLIKEDPAGAGSVPYLADSHFADLAQAVVKTRFEIRPGQGEADHWRWRVHPSKSLGELEERLTESAPEILADLTPTGDFKAPMGRETSEDDSDFDLRASNFLQQQAVITSQQTILSSSSTNSIFESRWIEEELILLRRVRQGEVELLQGIWLDWPPLQEVLQEVVEDLLPNLQLQPLELNNESQPRLALLPVRLLPPSLSQESPSSWTSVKWALLVCWLALLATLAGGFILIVGAQRLAKRRGDFVSAVTHELRTPLTTFELYTEMLHDDEVPPEKRPEYFRTLRAEASRLRHLVDNVLAFSRLEQRLRPPVQGSFTIQELLDRHGDSLKTLANQAGLQWVVEMTETAAVRQLQGTPEAVQRVLLNLVDNACKYAADGKPPELHLEAREKGRWLILRLRDFGPGISKKEAVRIFRPFHRSAVDAAGGPPGVGLGLAISRQLIRSLGGELLPKIPAEGPGALFEVRLKILEAQ